MKKVICFNTIPRPIRLDNRKEKLSKMIESDYEKLEEIKKKTKEILRKR